MLLEHALHFRVGDELIPALWVYLLHSSCEVLRREWHTIDIIVGISLLNGILHDLRHSVFSPDGLELRVGHAVESVVVLVQGLVNCNGWEVVLNGLVGDH